MIAEIAGGPPVGFAAMRCLAATARSDDLSLPVVVEADGRSCAVATDGRVLVAVTTDGDQIDELRRPGRLERSMREFIEEVPRDIRLVELQRLVAWAGEPTWVRACETCEARTFVVCEDCNGDKAVECMPADTFDGVCEHGLKTRHKAACEPCQGEGRINCACGSGTTAQPAQRYGWIGNVLVNRELLARALACVERDASVALGFGQGQGLASVILAGESWRIVLMPVRQDDKDKDAPRFDG